MMLFSDAPPIFSVTQVARYLKELLVDDALLQDVRVSGEISGCKTVASGHCYFTLKDADAQLACAFFKYARLRSVAPDLHDGMAVIVSGKISFYERDGKLQLYVDHVELAGQGALFQRFAQLKTRLEAEGLFDEERKRPLPPRPKTIGIVTSPEAAALRDMVRVLRTRYPLVKVVLAPTLVQGAEAPAAIAAAIDLLNQHGAAEVIIVGRGGGSIEELWAFNEEVVARAIAGSRIPIITGVGHETDFTIADFVADERASTPTAAATEVVPNIADFRLGILDRQRVLETTLQAYLEELGETLARAERELRRAHPQSLLDARRQSLDDVIALLQDRFNYYLALRKERLSGLELGLETLGPQRTLGRGYAIVRRDGDGNLITSVQQVLANESLIVQVADGTFPVTVKAHLTVPE
jgi:exodeoxyribonuclease VII large subunit